MTALLLRLVGELTAPGVAVDDVFFIGVAIEGVEIEEEAIE